MNHFARLARPTCLCKTSFFTTCQHFRCECLALASPGSRQLTKDTADRRVERRQLEGLEEHCRVHPLKEKLDPRIILVTGKKDEVFTGSRPDACHRPVKHLAPDLRHQHVANDEIEAGLHDFTQTLDAAPD